MRETLLTPLWSTRGRRVVLLLSAIVALAAVIASAGDHKDAQSALSLPLPFLGVLLADDVRARPALLWPRIAASTVAGIAGAVFTFLCCAIASGDWTAAPLPGSLVFQAVAVLIGLGFGLLIRPAWLAMFTDGVLPVGLWAIAGAAGLRSARRWLFPYGTVDHLASTHPYPVDWTREAVIVLLWVVGLLTIASRRTRHASRATELPAPPCYSRRPLSAGTAGPPPGSATSPRRVRPGTRRNRPRTSRGRSLAAR